MTLPDADTKLDAIQRLAQLEYISKGPGDEKDVLGSGIEEYLAEAHDILEVLGPEYDEAVALAIVRGLERASLVETIAAIMWDKEWNYETISKILMATVRKEVWKETA